MKLVATRLLLMVQAEQKKAAEDPAEQASSGHDIDLFADRHAGQYALRKLYHASPRTMVVFYSSPTCGPCRSLKPVFGRILDEFSGKVSSWYPKPMHKPLLPWSGEREGDGGD